MAVTLESHWVFDGLGGPNWTRQGAMQIARAVTENQTLTDAGLGPLACFSAAALGGLNAQRTAGKKVLKGNVALTEEWAVIQSRAQDSL